MKVISGSWVVDLYTDEGSENEPWVNSFACELKSFTCSRVFFKCEPQLFHTEKLNNVTHRVDRLTSDWLFFHVWITILTCSMKIMPHWTGQSQRHFFFFHERIKFPLSHGNYNFKMQKKKKKKRHVWYALLAYEWQCVHKKFSQLHVTDLFFFHMWISDLPHVHCGKTTNH